MVVPMACHSIARAVFLFVFFHLVRTSNLPSKHKVKDRVLLISFDGFRWNYLQRTNTPNFDRITKNGVQAAHGLTNAFITKTFPNHFTLVTGQWEETHGIIANHMYDPVMNKTFDPHDMDANIEAAWFDQGGEPIWVTNQLQKKDGKSGVIMWVGSSAPIKHVLPTKVMPFDVTVKNETKVDTMIQWFQDGCNLGLIYFNQPDEYGHIFGPESKEVTRMIGGLDEVIGYLLDKLEKENMLQNTNIIITSDHGFTSTPKDKSIDMNKIVDPSTYFVESSTPVAGVWPYPDFHDAIYENLTRAAKEGAHFTVYKKEEIPEHFHYSNNRRIPPIIVAADDHYSFSQGPPLWIEKGNHGYDNRLQDMHPFFVAMGPAFKSGFSVDTFESVDVYPLLCHIMGLRPAPNNGSMEVVGTLLVDRIFGNEGKEGVVSFLKKNYVGTIVIACIILSVVVISFAMAFRGFWNKRKRQRIEVIMDNVEVPSNGVERKSQMSNTSNTPLLHDQDF